MVAAARQKAAELKAGMDIFSIPQPPYKELGAMGGELEKLAEVWDVVAQWEGSYGAWKQSKFKDVQVRDFATTAFLHRWELQVSEHVFACCDRYLRGFCNFVTAGACRASRSVCYRATRCCE